MAESFNVYWSVLLERAVQDTAVNALLTLAQRAGHLGFMRLVMPYQRVDVARNRFVSKFLEVTDNSGHPNPADVLIMLDNDHNHPADLLERLVSHPTECGVVAAKAHRRGAPYDPVLFLRMEDGQLHSLADWEPEAKLIAGAVAGTGAIAIRRWVFDKLQAEGYGVPFFRYVYPDGQNFPTEDMYFGKLCEKVGIPHYMDMTLEIPHLTTTEITGRTWDDWKASHADTEHYLPAQATGIGKK